MVLVSSCFVSVFSDVSSFATGSSDKIIVSNEYELRSAVQNAEGSTVIALDKDIKLTGSYLQISSGKYITLTSNSNNKFFKIIGIHGYSTIEIVGGVLVIDGVIITHDTDSNGSGIFIHNSGTLKLFDGEISGNTGIGTGGGVHNCGSFELSGGVITNNIAFTSSGGGVGNVGSFVMSGGKITNNKAAERGGGVQTSDSFVMTGGEISDNIATDCGGGVQVYTRAASSCSFAMSGGKITNNKANYGGGVHVYCELSKSSFTMSGGEISKNTAVYNGGGVGFSGSYGLEMIYISNGAAFLNNVASVAYNRNSVDDDLYRSQIVSSVTWTSPFTQGYNNYDIQYTRGIPIDDGSKPNHSQLPDLSVSPDNNPPITGSPDNPDVNNGYKEFDFRNVTIVVLAVALIVTIVLIFHFKKRSSMQVSKKEVM
jgi:hypothetical protein